MLCADCPMFLLSGSCTSYSTKRRTSTKLYPNQISKALLLLACRSDKKFHYNCSVNLIPICFCFFWKTENFKRSQNLTSFHSKFHKPARCSGVEFLPCVSRQLIFSCVANFCTLARLPFLAASSNAASPVAKKKFFDSIFVMLF